MRGKDPVETIMDLVLEDRSRICTIYFLMSEDNIKKQIRQPWVSFGSDAASIAPEGIFLKSSAHPRAYGNFARLLGKYVREEKVILLTEAVRRLTSLPATNLGLDHRGFLKAGMFADVVVFTQHQVDVRIHVRSVEEDQQLERAVPALALQRAAGGGARRRPDSHHAGPERRVQQGERAPFPVQEEGDRREEQRVDDRQHAVE